MGRNIRTPLPDLRKMVYGKKDCRDTEDIPDEPARVSGNNANHDEIQQSKLPTTTGENAEPNTIQDDVSTNRNNYRRSLRLSRPPNRFGFDD